MQKYQLNKAFPWRNMLGVSVRHFLPLKENTFTIFVDNEYIN